MLELSVRFPLVRAGWTCARQAGVAQLVEQLIRNQQVIGSSPIAGSRISLENIDIGRSVASLPVQRCTDGGRIGADGISVRDSQSLQDAAHRRRRQWSWMKAGSL